MRSMARRTNRGMGIWLALAAVVACLVALGAQATSGRVDGAYRTVRRAIRESVLEEVALSAVEEAFCRCLAKANSPVGDPKWYQAFHDTCRQATVLGTIAATEASRLTTSLDYGIEATLDPVTVTLVASGADADGLASGWLQLDVKVVDQANELERNLQARRFFYLRGNVCTEASADPDVPATSSACPITVAVVVGGRARQDVWEGQ